MSLINVRLGKADEEAVKVLKEARVELSSVIRAALRREAERVRARTPRKTEALVDEIFAEFPEPVDAPARSFDVHDRQAFADAAREHLAGGRARRQGR